MKKLIFTLLGLLLYFSSFAQEEWLCVYTDKKVYFENTRKIVYCVRIDSISNDGTILYPFSFSELYEVRYRCFRIRPRSWLSKHIILDEGRNTFFINGNNQQFFIKNQAALNEVWNVFENENIKIKGKIISIEQETVLGVEDSVKTISFTVYDQNDMLVEHRLNQVSIEVSKSFGLVKTIGFYDLNPEQFNQYFYEFELIGINELQLGFYDFNLKEKYYDFQVGDELHIHSIHGDYNPYPNEYKTVTRYLSRIDNEDEIVYTYERKRNSNIPRDTLSMTIMKGEALFNTEPNELYANDPFLSEVIIYNLPLPRMVIHDYVGYQEDSCWRPIIANAMIDTYNYFFGLGGPYYRGSEPYYAAVNELVYYKKGDTEWGTPFDFNVSVQEYKKDVSFNIYPTLVENVLYIATDKNIEDFDYKIINVQGQVTNEGVLTSNTINVASLSKGFYLVVISDKKNKKYIKKQKIVKY